MRIVRTTGVAALAIALASLGPAAIANAQPDRGPNKSTPHSSPSGGNDSSHVRRGAEPDRSPRKSTPGGNNNDNHTRYGAEPDRSPHKFTPGTTGDQIPDVVSGRGTHPGPSTAAPRNRPDADSRANPAPARPSTAPQQPSTRPETATTPPSQKVPQSAAPSRQAPNVRIGSVVGGADVPGSSIVSDCASGCVSSSASSGTTRVFTPDQARPGYDPRTATVDISPGSTTARGGFSENLITPNPNYFSEGNAGIPVPDRGTPNTGVGAGGQVGKPGTGGTLDVSGRSQIELRIARAVPDENYPVNTQFGPGTAVHYHYEYEARSITGVAVNDIGVNHRSDWSPVTQAQVDDLAKRGVPVPRVN